MKIDNEQRGSCTLISVSGRLDVVSAPEFQKACVELAEQGNGQMAVDLGGLEYISSAGLRSVLFLAKKLKGSGGELKFCGLTGMVEEVFRVSGFYSMFTIVPTADDI
ncbi:STAS domain-containing protein [Desulfovibrio ferrophilus]|uniref:Anti-sigma factor antagonist n=1 Tax=Desulfovibrio ferrophilus TaxID=241368 RepID=A0A2Z6AVR9_9BACT|nr:STAS domain-containing protein [Desulfovibrio ferrophilus]BBD07286.1 anti-sigma factor antagonist [Desulfovibrio ferrophilus]